MRTTVALAGLGARGYNTYAQYQHLFPDRMQIVAVADIDRDKVARAGDEFGVPENRRFLSAEDMFAAGKLADCVFISTQDGQHHGHTLAALDLSYDILLEKPVATSLAHCLEIQKKTKEAGRLVIVCHVLRYTAFYKTVKDIIDRGGIGEVISIEATESVGYWHQAHSFVRGNWRNSFQTSPMILQKCCHDFDIISWLIGGKCISLNSYGSLKYFLEKNAPEGSAPYCNACKIKDSCEYSAYKIYLDNDIIGFNSGNRSWPCNVITPDPTEASLKKALETSPYGRCVFRCDNDVVDHQTVNMLFENEVTATLTMCGFTSKNARSIRVMGTKGDIVGEQDGNMITHTPFGGTPVIYDINKLSDDLSGHGGGDNAMLTTLFDALQNNGTLDFSSTIDSSIQSHVMAFAAEASRRANGETIVLDGFSEAVAPSNESRLASPNTPHDERAKALKTG